MYQRDLSTSPSVPGDPAPSNESCKKHFATSGTQGVVPAGSSGLSDTSQARSRTSGPRLRTKSGGQLISGSPNVEKVKLVER